MAGRATHEETSGQVTRGWRVVSYDRWAATCDTLHAHTQVLGKLAVQLAPPEPQFAACGAAADRTGLGDRAAAGARWLGLAGGGAGPAGPCGGGGAQRRLVERVPLTPDRAVAEVTGDVLAAVARMAGPVAIDPRPQEVPWSVPLDQDDEHARYDPGQVRDYFAAATEAALALAAFRAPFRGRSTPVNAWWGSFDLAVTLFSGAPADPPGRDFITRNAGDAEAVNVGWWPGDAHHPRRRCSRMHIRRRPSSRGPPLSPAGARWDEQLGEYLLDWDDVRAAADPRAAAVEFARSVFRHACVVCDWDAELAATLEGRPPPVW